MEIVRSAEVLTLVPSIAELLAVLGSETPEVAVAVLEMSVVREGSTFTTSVTALFALAAMVPSDQVTVPAVFVPPLEADTKLVPAGRSSL